MTDSSPGQAASFPRQLARTQRFSLGLPHAFRVSPDGGIVTFLRSRGGTDPVTCLWALDVAGGQEHLVADPAALAAREDDLPAEEKARRERSRQQARGIVSYATDRQMRRAVFALGGRVYLAGLPRPGEPGTVREIATQLPALDPRLDPAGRQVSYVCRGALHVIDASTGQDTVLADPAGQPELQYGLAEFIAAEEMGRMRGYWWAPDGSALLIARVDETPVQRWHIADPANPDRPPAEVAYPAAGTPNADVSLLLARPGRTGAGSTGADGTGARAVLEPATPEPTARSRRSAGTGPCSPTW